MPTHQIATSGYGLVARNDSATQETIPRRRARSSHLSKFPTTRAGFPATIAPSATSRLTTYWPRQLRAAQWSPGKITAPAPIKHESGFGRGRLASRSRTRPARVVRQHRRMGDQTIGTDLDEKRKQRVQRAIDKADVGPDFHPQGPEPFRSQGVFALHGFRSPAKQLVSNRFDDCPGIRDLFSAALPDHPSGTPPTIKLGATLCVTTAPAATHPCPKRPGQNDRRGTNKDIVR